MSPAVFLRLHIHPRVQQPIEGGFALHLAGDEIHEILYLRQLLRRELLDLPADRASLATGKLAKAIALTADRAWLALDIGVKIGAVR